MLIVGNSHAAQIAIEVALTWRAQYSQLKTFTIRQCIPIAIRAIDPVDWKVWNCEEYVKAVEAVVRRTKPDVLIINFR